MNNTLSRSQYWKFALLVTTLAVVVTAWFTRPLLSQFRTHIPGLQGDALEHLWTIWWFDQAIFTRGQLPSALDAINFPAELEHPILTAGFWARTVSIPIVRQFGPVVAYNLHLFVSYALNWLFMSLLCLELTRNRAAAIIGGAVFTYFVNHTMHVFYGHWTIALTYPLPFLILMLWLVIKRPSIWKSLALGGALIVSATIDLPPLAHATIPLVTAVLIFFLIADRRQILAPTVLKHLGFSFGLAALVLVPIMWPFLASIFTGALDWYGEVGVGTFSADLLSAVVPPSGHFLTRIWPGIQMLSDNIYSFDVSITESVVYIGWPALLLAGVGLFWGWERRPDVRLWFTLAAVLYVLALGPILRVAGKVITLNGQWVILPYFLLMKTPLFAWGRAPARFYFAIMFAVAILSAYGAGYLLDRLSSRRWAVVGTAVMLTLILIDGSYFTEWPMIDVSNIPAFYDELAKDPRPVAVLDVPVLDYDAAKYHMLYQMSHGHTLVGGYNYRLRPDVVQTMIRLETLAKPGGAPQQLAEIGVGYIVLHRRFLSLEELDETARYLAEEIGEPIYQDDQITAFFVPDALEIAPPPLVPARR